MSNLDSFFQGGDYVPGWWTGAVGNSIVGKILEIEQQDQTDFNTGNPIPDGKGGIKQQLRVVLETQMRNWEGLKNPPTRQDEHGNFSPMPPSEDDGRRAVYVKGWMTGAVGDAVKAATGVVGAPRVGGQLAIRVTELVPTNKGNPFPKFEAQYKPPAVGESMFQEVADQQQAAQQPPQQGGWGQQAAQQPQQQAQPQPQQQAPQQPQQQGGWNPQGAPQPQQQAAQQPQQDQNPWVGAEEPPF